MKTSNTGIPENLALCQLTIDHGALCENWLHLKRASGNARTGAVVKADAYGLGLEEVVASLSFVGCEVFFVANPHEGIRVRNTNKTCEIFVLAGINNQNAGAYGEARLIPVLNSLSEIEIWANYWKLRGNRKPCAVQIDTGINRLGLNAQEVEHLAQNKALRHSVTIINVLSHLACADDKNHPMNERQRELFIKLAQTFPGSELSLSNSAGVFMGKDFHFGLTRPGIAIYGGECFDDCSHTLKPVVSAKAKFVQIRKVLKGETIGYGATKKFDKECTIALIGCGYGDGLPRSMSGSGVALRDGTKTTGGQGFIGGKYVDIVGRISMDSAAFDVSDVDSKLLENDPAIELFGENISVGDVARAAGTISYEILTSLGSRYQRKHINIPEGAEIG